MKVPVILIVEDDLISRMSLEIQIEEAQLGKTLLAKNDVEVFNIIKENTVSVILLDINLINSMSGIEIAKRVKQEYNIPTIFLSGNNDIDTLNEVKRITPFKLLTKPYNTAEVKNAVKEALRTGHEVPLGSDMDDSQILHLIYDTAQIGMCVTDKRGNFVRVNNAYCITYGYTSDELVGRNFTMVLPVTTREYAQKIHDDFIGQHLKEFPSDWQIQTSSGEIKDIFVTAGRFEDKAGEPFKVTTVTDITERKKYQEQIEKNLKQKAVLEKEVHHRVKNNLNLLSNMFKLQQKRAEADLKVKEALESGINRINSISILHERLYKQGDIETIKIHEYLNDIGKQIFGEDFNNKNMSYQIGGIEANVDVGVSIGLISNELFTNIVKHAFTELNDNCKVIISIEEKEEHFEYVVSDNGKPLPDNFMKENVNSLGIQLITVLSEQLHGHFNYRQDKGWKHFIITIQKDFIIPK